MNLRTLLVATTATFLSMVVAFVLKTYADTVFLSEFGVAYLPHFFVAQAVATILSSATYGAIIRRGPSLTTDLVVLSALAASGLVAPSLTARGGPWVFGVTLALLVLATLASLVVWNAATAVVSGRAARSFIPRAGAAATAGAILGGFGASAVVAGASVSALAPCGGVIAGVLALQVALLARHRETRRRPTRTRAKGPARPALSTSSIKLVKLLIAAAVLEALLGAFIDFGFKDAVTRSFDRERMGLFFALFYGTANVALLALQLFVSGRLLAAKSLRVSLTLEPLLLVLVTGCWAIAPLLALAAAGRGTEMIMKFALARPAQEVALSPLPETERQRWKVLLRGVFSQGGAAAGGLLLLVGTGMWQHYPAIAPITMAILAAAWLLVQRRIARRYLDTLGSTLGMLRLSRGAGEVVRLDRDGLAKVIDVVGSPDRDLANFGADLLGQLVDDTSVLAPHLGHPNPTVRATLYGLLAASPTRACLPALRRAVTVEPADSPAMAEGLSALAAYGDPTAIDRARELTADVPLAELADRCRGGDRRLTAAWAYLAEVGALDQDPTTLDTVLRGVLSCDGVRAARLYDLALSRHQIAEETADQALVAAINGDSPGVSRQGLRAAAVLGRSRPLVELLKALDDNRPGADEALGHLDSAGMGRLILLANARQTPPRLRARLIRGLRSSSLAEATEVAARALHDEDPTVRDLAVHNLLKAAREEPGRISRELVEAALVNQLDRFEIYLRARKGSTIGRESSMSFRHDSSLINADFFLLDELERRTELALSRLCTLLALLGNPKKVYAAERALRAPQFRSRHRGVDILQEVARNAHRTRLFELLDLYLKPAPTVSDADRQAVLDLDPWLARCATRQLAHSHLWYLRSTLLFDHVDGEALAVLAEHVSEIEYAAGEVVVRQGEPGDALYIIASGTLTVEREDQEVATLTTGQSFGELALIDQEERQATVRAVNRTTLLRLPRAPFFQALSEHPEIGLGLLRGLAAWLRQPLAAD